jgi:putative endonuclease
VHGDINAAITREKSMKRWLRKWKIAAIEKQNKSWRDLYFQII